METEPLPVTPRTEYDSPERKRAARLMLGESSVMGVPNAAHAYFAPAFAIRLGASAFQMGLFTAATQLTIALSQLGAAYLVGPLGGRKRMVITTVLISGSPWLLMALVPFIPRPFQVWSLIPLAGIAVALLQLSDPAWGSWISDLVPVQRRGSFMGLRTSLLALVTMSVGMGGAALLDQLHGAVMWGFVAIFLVTMATRVLSALIFALAIDPRPDLRAWRPASPWKQFAGMGRSKLGRFNLFIMVFHFAAGVGGPFVSIYLLRDLGLSYTTFVGLGVAEGVTAAVTRLVWGHLADTRGTRLVLALSALGAASWPFLFVISAETWYLWLVRPLTGAAVAGWGIATYNFVLENSEDETRPSSVGYFHAMTSAGTFGGVLVGGAIAAHLPTIFAYQMMTLFFLSGVLRLTSVMVFLPRIEGLGGRTHRRRLALLSTLPRTLARGAAIWHGILALGKGGPH